MSYLGMMDAASATDLSCSKRWLWFHVEKLAFRSRAVTRTFKELAVLVGVSVDTIARDALDLVKAGIFRMTKKPGNAPVFELTRSYSDTDQVSEPAFVQPEGSPQFADLGGQNTDQVVRNLRTSSPRFAEEKSAICGLVEDPHLICESKKERIDSDRKDSTLARASQVQKMDGGDKPSLDDLLTWDALDVVRAWNTVASEHGLAVEPETVATNSPDLRRAVTSPVAKASVLSAIAVVPRSSFLLGKVKRFKVDLFWLIEPGHLSKINAGRYTDDAPRKTAKEEKWERDRADREQWEASLRAMEDEREARTGIKPRRFMENILAGRIPA